MTADRTPPEHSPKMYGRREVLKLAGAATASAFLTTLGLRHFIIDNQAETVNQQHLQDQLKNAQNKKEQEDIFKDHARLYLEEYDTQKEAGNRKIQYPIPTPNGSAYTPELSGLRENARLLMEKGVLLVATWNSLQGEETPRFNSPGRLSLEGKNLRTSEDRFDYHLALNIIRAKLAFITEEDDKKKPVVKEDLDDVLKLADINPKVEVDLDAFLIMPESWILNISRYYQILDRQKVFYPEKIIIGERNPSVAGQYVGGIYHGRFPQENQFLFISPKRADPSSIFHEGGHYLYDIEASKSRVIGAKEKPKDLKSVYQKAVAKAQKIFYQSGIGDELLTFLTPYSMTNEQEDFADTMQIFCSEGPLFRARIEYLEDKDPEAAKVLKARYDAVKEILGGWEYSFDGHKKDDSLADWEDDLKKSPKYRWDKSKGQKAYQRTIRQSTTDIEEGEKRRGTPGLGNPNVIAVIPSDLDFAKSLTDLSYWNQKYKGFDADEVLQQYPVGHLELRGKFIARGNNNTNQAIGIDTSDPTESVKAIVRNFPALNGMIVGEPDDALREKLKKAGLNVFGSGTPAITRSYPPSLISTMDYYVQFQWNKTFNSWGFIPIQSRVAILKRSFAGTPQTNEQIEVQFGDKDIFLKINPDGTIRDLYINGDPTTTL